MTSPTPPPQKIAVLIDADNTLVSKIQDILTELAAYGQIVVKRAYGDWSGDPLKSWKTPLNELAIQPVQQFSYTKGKNSSDAALIIDAMDLLYSGRVNVFALISSDSDFTRLATRLRESDMSVIGVGEAKTPLALKNACNRFILVENLTASTEKKPAQNKRPATGATPLLLQAWNQHQEEDGWVPVNLAGNFIKGHSPDFDPRTYGAQKLTDLIRSLPNRFELREQSKNGNHKFFWYRPKKRPEASTTK